MIQSIVIDRNTKDGEYATIVDVCEFLAADKLGSATNAAAVMMRSSPLFKKTLENQLFKELWEKRDGRNKASKPVTVDDSG